MTKGSKTTPWAGGDFRWIRGANYVPSYATTDVQIWLNYDHDIIDRELGYAERIKCNSIRIFLQQLIYEHNPKKFLKNLSDFVDLCDKHGIRPMLVLFDSCFGVSPSLESDAIWVANPGPDHMGKEYWPQSEKYACDVVGLFKRDKRVLIWDIMNEPTATWLAFTPAGGKQIWDFCRHFCDYVKSVDDSHPITVGVAGTDNSEIINHVDVLSMHCYALKEEEFMKAIEDTRRQANEARKPFIISECGTADEKVGYELCVPLARRLKIGWYFWELMIGRDQFRSYQGIFYPDGTVRRLPQISTILGKSAEGFIEKPDEEGAPIRKEHRNLWKEVFERLRNTETTKGNFSEKSTLVYATYFSMLHQARIQIETAKKNYAKGELKKAFSDVDQQLELAYKRWSSK